MPWILNSASPFEPTNNCVFFRKRLVGNNFNWLSVIYLDYFDIINDIDCVPREANWFRLRVASDSEVLKLLESSQETTNTNVQNRTSKLTIQTRVDSKFVASQY